MERIIRGVGHQSDRKLAQLIIARNVKESSIIAVQIFDQKKFKKKDQGFLGVINLRVGDALDLSLGGDGMSICRRTFRQT